jgi:Xaa-Pro aminopeptidase
MEQWTGRKMHKGNVKNFLGIESAEDLDKFKPDFENQLRKCKYLYISFRETENQVRKIISSITTVKQNIRRQPFAFAGLLDSDLLLHEARLHKNRFEISQIRKALKITEKSFIKIMSSKLEREFEGNVRFSLENEFFNGGGTSLAFPSIVAGGNNANILHYISAENYLKKNDLILVDAGADYENYAADITRTFPVGLTFTPAQKDVYELVLKVQIQACRDVRPGETMAQLHKKVISGLTRGMIRLGILKGSLQNNIKKKKFFKYYMHNTGHWLGIDVHDRGLYFLKDSKDKFYSRPFKAGMITTIEPGLYLPKNDKAIPARYRGIGIRIEDNVLVTRNGNEILSKNIPKSVKEIELLRRKQLKLN